MLYSSYQILFPSLRQTNNPIRISLKSSIFYLKEREKSGLAEIKMNLRFWKISGSKPPHGVGQLEQICSVAVPEITIGILMVKLP